MATTAKQTVKVTEYATPNVDVRIARMSLNLKDKKATFFLSTREPGKKKWSAEKEVSAFMTKELIFWFTEYLDDKVKVVADNERGCEWIKTGKKSTGFQRFLAHKDIPFQPGILSEIVFECHNNSEDRSLNPFRVFIGKENATITLVNVPSKKRVEKIDPETGEVSVSYHQRYGKLASGVIVKSFYKKEAYRRLIIQQEKEVEVAPQE